MQDAMFSGLFGALTTEHRMNSIANNLANVNTHGYKADKLAFKDNLAYYAHDEIREPILNLRDKSLFPEQKNMSRVRIAVSRIDFTQGAMHLTNNPLDVAINGENAFFKVQTPNGEFLTRNGHFALSADGTIMTPQGYTVMGEGGAITVPQGTRHINISGDGQVEADNTVVGRIQVVSVDAPHNLEKKGYNLYKARENTTIAESDAFANNRVRLEQGYMETANVEVVSEMVNMIETNRQFEAYQKVMQTADTLDRAANERIGKRLG